jgi:hypothetical protein
MAATRRGSGFQRGHVGAIRLEPTDDRSGRGQGDGWRGEVLRIEVPHLEVGWGGVGLRDTVLVTTKGSAVLNRSARGLVVLD